MPDENLFEDLPEEGEGQEPEGDEGTNTDGEELTPEEKEQRDEQIRKLTIANKKEDERLARLRENLSNKRREVKKLRQNIEEGKEDEEGEEPKKDTPPENIIKKTIEATLREKEAEKTRQEMVAKIRGVAKTKQEAERLLEEASKFPKDWSVEERVTYAKQRLENVRNQSRGFVPPSPTGAGVFDDLDAKVSTDTGEIPGMSKERVASLMKVGWTREMILKHKDGPNLRHVWPENKMEQEF